MASTKLMQTKDGRRFYKISVSRGYGITPYTTRWYIPDGMTSQRAIDSGLKKAIIEFERKIEDKQVLTRAQAKEKAAQEAAEAARLAAEAAAEAAKIKTVKQYADGVFMPAKEALLSENTRANYRMMLDKHILPVLGDIPLQSVEPAMISKLLLDYQTAGYSHASAIKLYNVLKGVFDMAFMDDSIDKSPMLKVKRPMQRKDEKTVNEADKALTAEQLRYVLTCADKEPLIWRTFIHLAADSGARRGELCGLKWQDVDWQAETITIRRNLQYSPQKGVYVTNTKTGKVRTVDIGETTLSLLRQLRDSQNVIDIDGGGWVFSQSGTTEPMFPDSPTLYFRKFGERYGIEGFHPHLLRHTSASLALTAGADIKSIAERLGHSEAVLIRKYAHANEDSIRRAGQLARDALKAQNE